MTTAAHAVMAEHLDSFASSMAQTLATMDAELDAQHKAKEAELKRLLAELEGAAKESTEAKARYDTIINQRDAAVADAQKDTSAQTQKMIDETQSMKQEIEELSEECNQHETALGVLRSTHTSDVSINVQISQCMNDLAVSKKAAEQLRSTRQRVAELEEKLSEVADAQQRLDVALAKDGESKSRYKEVLLKSKRVVRETEALEAELADNNVADAKRRLDAAKDAHRTLAMQIRTLRVQHTSTTNQLVQQKAESAHDGLGVNALKAAREAAEREIAALSREHEILERDIHYLALQLPTKILSELEGMRLSISSIVEERRSGQVSQVHSQMPSQATSPARGDYPVPHAASQQSQLQDDEDDLLSQAESSTLKRRKRSVK
eukprot:PhM_4_TR1924/c0_g1_i1/m.87914